MNSFQIKILAIVSMTIAHVGLFFFENPLWMYAFGRLAFPLFAWLLANGAIHTKNTKKYAVRLLIFGLISQIPFVMANRTVDPNYWGLNIMFTLFLGLLAINTTKNKTLPLKFFILFLFFCTGYILQVDYGGMGILCIAAFYYFFNSKIKLLISQFLIIVGINITLLLNLVSQNANTLVNPLYFLPYGVFALIPIFLYNSQQGRKMKYLFYAFYPLHYVVILLLLHYL